MRLLVQKLKIDQEPNPSHGIDAVIAQFVYKKELHNLCYHTPDLGNM